MAAVRDKNVRGKNGDRSVDTVDTIYWNTDLCKPVSVHKYLVHQNTRTPVHQFTSTPVHQYTSTQNGDRSVQAGERKPRPGLNVASFEGG